MFIVVDRSHYQDTSFDVFFMDVHNIRESGAYIKSLLLELESPGFQKLVLAIRLVISNMLAELDLELLSQLLQRFKRCGKIWSRKDFCSPQDCKRRSWSWSRCRSRQNFINTIYDFQIVQR